MEYHLEIRRPGNCEPEGCIKTFTSATGDVPKIVEI